MDICELIAGIDRAKSALELRRLRKKAARIMPQEMKTIDVAIDQQFALLNSIEIGEQKPRWK